MLFSSNSERLSTLSESVASESLCWTDMLCIICFIIICICVRAADESLWFSSLLNLSAFWAELEEPDILLSFTVRSESCLLKKWDLVDWIDKLSSSETVKEYYVSWIDSFTDVSDFSVILLKGVFSADANDSFFDFFKLSVAESDCDWVMMSVSFT